MANTKKYNLFTDDSGMVSDPANAGYEGQDGPDIIEKVGVWRWPLVDKWKTKLLPLIEDAETVLDFGGSAGPLGYGSIIVDWHDPKHKSFLDVPGKVDLIFSSHTVEHVADFEGLMYAVRYKLKPGGWCCFHVPSWKMECWQAENNDQHEWTFSLAPCGSEWINLRQWFENVFNNVITDEDEKNLIIFGRRGVN